jgi:hypothetical protein
MIGHQYTSNHQQCIREGREDFTRYTALVKASIFCWWVCMTKPQLTGPPHLTMSRYGGRMDTCFEHFSEALVSEIMSRHHYEVEAKAQKSSQSRAHANSWPFTRQKRTDLTNYTPFFVCLG